MFGDVVVPYRGRVVTVSSSVHNLASGMRWDDLHFSRPRSYSMFPCYGQSKLANILFTKELHRQVYAKRVTAVAVHPGCIQTNITQHLNPVFSFYISLQLHLLVFS